MTEHCDLDEFFDRVEQRHPHQPEYLQAVRETVADVWPLVQRNRQYRESRVLERLTEPDRIVSFRVLWEDDDGELHVNRGHRVQTTNALGPYKGGLRFHPTVNLSVLKFLAFEQTFKNSLTGLSIGSGKGGADFDPKHRSNSEIRRFCQSFMGELANHIGPDTDVPAGDIGVGNREIGYLFGQYKRLRGAFEGAMTGKPMCFGGSALRVEATGYGVVYFAREALTHCGDTLSRKRCAISGAGNVARYCAEKLLEADCVVVSLSDSGGFLHADDGLTSEHLEWLKNGNGSLHELADHFDLRYEEGSKPWGTDCDLAFPCATQNELDEDDARNLAEGGCAWVIEGANMPCTAGALSVLQDKGVRNCPGKAANAGGVAVSALEMSQNASFQRWSRERVDKKLSGIMSKIHDHCVAHFDDDDQDYPKAANRAAFVTVADALVAQGA